MEVVTKMLWEKLNQRPQQNREDLDAPSDPKGNGAVKNPFQGVSEEDMTQEWKLLRSFIETGKMDLSSKLGPIWAYAIRTEPELKAEYAQIKGREATL